jgi:hypothetical protein
MRRDELDQGETPRTDWEMEMGMDTHRPDGNGPDTRGPGSNRRRRASRSLLIALATAIALTAGVASAGAGTGSSIEQVWSFGGGEIAIQPEGNGKLEGIVEQPTRFATCTHPAGEKIWKEMTLQPDGSYWGYHQWFNTPSASSTECTYDPTPGKTAWRILSGANGAYTLHVCLSRPSENTQPTIAANGAPFKESEYAAYGVTYGCYESTLIGPLPASGSAGSSAGKSGVAGSKESLTFSPSNKKCLSLRLFKIHLLEPTSDPFKTVSVTLKGRKIATVHRGNYVVATINLRGLRKGAFTIKIKATTTLGNHLSDSRTYHTCAKKKLKPHNKLKLSKEKK